MTSSPNFLFIIADDHRSASLGVHGCSEVSTPNLDAVAARGVDFTNAHCQGGFNAAVCVPSRASVLTGRNVFDLAAPEMRDVRDFSAGQEIPPAMATMPERLRKAGYHTHAVGKWHNDKASFARCFASAESILFDGMSEHEAMILQDFDPDGTYDESRSRHVPGHSTDIFRDATIRFLETQAREEVKGPFFLYLAFTAPHDPRTPTPEFERAGSDVSLPAAYAPTHPFDNGEALVRDELLEEFPRSEEAVRQHLADYYGMIAQMDNAIGEIIATLERIGQLENTVIVFTSDHGLSVGNHGLMGKQNLYEHSIGIPLIMAGPSIPAGQVRDPLVWHADTHATVLGLAGLAPDAQCAGQDLRPVMQDENATPPRELFSAVYRSSQRMIRDHRYKLIRYYENSAVPDDSRTPTVGSRLEQLFDLENDPDELINLINAPQYRDIRTRLRNALSLWQKQSGDHLR